jgi:prophage regulatory protein
MIETASQNSLTRESIIRLPAVMQHTGLGRSSIYRMAANGEFPKPLKLGAHASGWRWGEILDWLLSRERVE